MYKTLSDKSGSHTILHYHAMMLRNGGKMSEKIQIHSLLKNRGQIKIDVP